MVANSVCVCVCVKRWRKLVNYYFPWFFSWFHSCELNFPPSEKHIHPSAFTHAASVTSHVSDNKGDNDLSRANPWRNLPTEERLCCSLRWCLVVPSSPRPRGTGWIIHNPLGACQPAAEAAEGKTPWRPDCKFSSPAVDLDLQFTAESRGERWPCYSDRDFQRQPGRILKADKRVCFSLSSQQSDVSTKFQLVRQLKARKLFVKMFV